MSYLGKLILSRKGGNWMDTITKVQLEHIHKSFTTETQSIQVLSDINVSVKEGEFVTILGASGCGKSTLLRIIAGLDTTYEGTMRIDGKKTNTIGQNRSMVFQDHRLFPWMTVEENIGFALNKLNIKDRQEVIKYYIDLIGLNGFEKSKPSQLSGGMSQRVAIARALAIKPDIVLFDEPFGALDAMTRIQMQQEVLKIREKETTTMILVTHDIEEAILLGDRVLVMSKNPGQIAFEIPIRLSRPRDRNSSDFLSIKERIFDIFFSDLKVEKVEDFSI